MADRVLAADVNGSCSLSEKDFLRLVLIRSCRAFFRDVSSLSRGSDRGSGAERKKKARKGLSVPSKIPIWQNRPQREGGD